MPWARSFCPFRACGDMMVFWYLRRVGTWWCSDVWGVWGHDDVLMPGACGDMIVFWCLGRVGLTCETWMYTYARKRMQQLTQVVQSDYSSGSVSLFKWFSQLTQVAQSDYSSGSISLLKWLNQTTQVAQSASTAVCVTQFSHILNPMQPSA